MKLRAVTPLNVATLLAALLLGVALYKYFQKNTSSDDMKSQLTSENNTPNAPKGLKAIIAGNLQKQAEMTERLDFNETMVAQERLYTEKEINDMTPAQFAALIKETELKLPKLSDIKSIPAGALHRIPAPVMRAGKDLGLIKEILKVHESYTPQALVLYQNCAGNNERPTPVRALCLTNLIEIKKKNGERINASDYPPQVVDLTKMVIDL